MAKKFLETSYSKQRIKKFPRGKFDQYDDGMPQKDNMRRVHYRCFDSGSIGTDFSLMRRFLQSRLGTPWDSVYAEICQKIDRRSWQGNHYHQWLEYVVLRNCQIQDGEVLSDKGIPIFGDFFVHPEKLTLEFSQPRKYRYHRKEVVDFKLNDQHYFFHNDIWYRVSYCSYPNGLYVTDAFFGLIGRFTKSKLWAYPPDNNGNFQYCLKKESANHKEISKIKKKYSLK